MKLARWQLGHDRRERERDDLKHNLAYLFVAQVSGTEGALPFLYPNDGPPLLEHAQQRH